MRRTKLFVWVLAAALLLCACSAKTSNSASAYPDNRDEMAVVGVNARYPAVQSQTVEHGEDYVIQWEDPAMEAHIRSVLDRPKGDILHSDVWNIQVLVLRASSADGYDVALEQPTDGDSFTFEMVEMNPAVRHSYHGTAFQNLSTLADLKHFDGLQYFSYRASLPYDTLTDLSGLSVCNGLKVLFLRNVKPGSLTSLESLQNLQTLTLSNCGTLDIAPLAPKHFLVIPKQHFASAAEVTEENAALIGHIYTVIAKLAKEQGFADGYRVVTNVGDLAGQTVHHIHFHVLSGKQLGSFN